MSAFGAWELEFARSRGEIGNRNRFWFGQENEIRQRMARTRREYDGVEHRQRELGHYYGETDVNGQLWSPKHPDDQYLPINLWDETP
jgi:hypothetical protein